MRCAEQRDELVAYRGPSPSAIGCDARSFSPPVAQYAAWKEIAAYLHRSALKKAYTKHIAKSKQPSPPTVTAEVREPDALD